MNYCEICEVIFVLGEREFYVIEKEKRVKKIVYQDWHNTQSEENSNRCLECLNAEEKIKDNCGGCGNTIYIDLHYYKANGNTCRNCIFKVNRVLEVKKEINIKNDEIFKLNKEIQFRNLNEEELLEYKDKRPKDLVEKTEPELKKMILFNLNIISELKIKIKNLYEINII